MTRVGSDCKTGVDGGSVNTEPIVRQVGVCVDRGKERVETLQHTFKGRTL